ncbi:orotidine 5'-phosphate decarboxylase / HUMPS family protein [Knoellia sp. S7-12]|uniref:orotidine 5'-phosphate decarboxylase / HUMPS family protein n=1 Tax=Knoellia sp. S7-12 TaxID=3126698 RepID=UPI0033693EA7
MNPHIAAPIVQIAIDVTEPARAIALAHSAMEAGADWLEVGKPFIEFNGLAGARELIQSVPDAYWLIDLMVIAGSRRYVEAAKGLNARNVTVSALSPEATVDEAITLGREAGVDVTVDLFNVADPVAQARRTEARGAPYVMVHIGVDQKRLGGDEHAIDLLRKVVNAVSVPVSFAAYDVEEARAAVEAGASIIVQGEPLISAQDVDGVLRDYIDAVHAFRPRGDSKPAPEGKFV